MESAKFDRKALENWWMLLRDLNTDLRIELASRLIDSLKPKNESTEESTEDEWMKLFGAWANEEKTAEELIAEIKASRLSNRQIESFD